MAYKVRGFTDQWMAAVINAAGYYDQSYMVRRISLSASASGQHVFTVYADDPSAEDGNAVVSLQLDTAWLLTQAALARPHSLGAHFRVD